MTAFGLAAVGKLIDLPTFERDLHSWALIPAWARLPMTILLPFVELGLAVGWFMGVRRPHLRVLGAMLLSVFACSYAAHVVLSTPPTCGCFGLIDEYFFQRHSTLIGIMRDVGLAALLMPGIVWDARTRRGAVAAMLTKQEEPTKRAPSSPTGFTLMEVLVTLSIVVVLIALSLAGIRGVVIHARGTKSLAQIQSHAATILAYTSDYRDTFPILMDPAVPEGLVTLPGHTQPVHMYYFEQHLAWPAAIVQGPEHRSHAYRSPLQANANRTIDYQYPCAFLADPDYWDLTTRTGLSQRRATKLHEVRYPAAKLILLDFASYFDELNDPIPNAVGIVASVGGSARRHDVRFFGQGVESGDGPPWEGAMHPFDVIRGFHTIRGVAGTDQLSP